MHNFTLQTSDRERYLFGWKNHKIAWCFPYFFSASFTNSRTVAHLLSVLRLDSERSADVHCVQTISHKWITFSVCVKWECVLLLPSSQTPEKKSNFIAAAQLFKLWRNNTIRIHLPTRAKFLLQKYRKRRKKAANKIHSVLRISPKLESTSR